MNALAALIDFLGRSVPVKGISWITGPPGSGKTIVCQLAVRHFQATGRGVFYGRLRDLDPRNPRPTLDEIIARCWSCNAALDMGAPPPLHRIPGFIFDDYHEIDSAIDSTFVLRQIMRASAVPVVIATRDLDQGSAGTVLMELRPRIDQPWWRPSRTTGPHADEGPLSAITAQGARDERAILNAADAYRKLTEGA